MEKIFRIVLWTSAWNGVAWKLVFEVLKKVLEGFIPNSEISILLSRDGNSQYYDSFKENAQSNGARLLEFPTTIDFQNKNWRKAKKAAQNGNKELVRQWRTEHDREILRLFPELATADLHVALGWMRIFSEEMCAILGAINLHPDLPGRYMGTFYDVIRQLVLDGEQIGGVMMHLLTKELDMGPAISYCKYDIESPGSNFPMLWQMWIDACDDDPREVFVNLSDEQCDANALFGYIRGLGVAREVPLILWTIKAIVEGRIRIDNGQVSDADGNILRGGYDLTEKINQMLVNRKE